MRMRKIKSAFAALAVIAGVLGIPGTASAESVYTTSAVERCIGSYPANCVYLQAYSTYSRSQIWINGIVTCSGTQYVIVTWCKNTNNGQSYLNIGVNFTILPHSGGGNTPTGSFYYRMNIYANGNGCYSWGSNADVNGNRWYQALYQCEAPA
jgi:hypothetical protein